MRSLVAIGFVALATVTGCTIKVTKTGDRDGRVASAMTAVEGQPLRCAPDDLFGTSALAICGDLTGAGEVSIDGDLAVQGDLTGAGSIDVSGDVSIGGDVSHAGDFDIGGQVKHVRVAPCGKAGIDVAAAVANARVDHDHEAATELGDGRYYFADATFVGEHRIHVTGHASMFVDGDLDAVGESHLFVEAGATLDLYVAGSVSAVGNVTAAGCDPNALRIFVGGAGSVIAGAGETELRGFIYAPDAEVTLAGDTRVTGALVARELTFSGELRVDGVAPRPRPSSACGRVTAVPKVD